MQIPQPAPPTNPKALGVALPPQVTCPHCWHRFAPTQTLWIARHEGLRGDPVAGSDAMARFRPSRFTPSGAAIDAFGQACHELACPRCHLEVPRVLFETRPVFMSLIGSPGSGKSNLLAAMAWRCRAIFGPRFQLGFRDADPSANLLLNEYEQKLFLQDDPSAWVVLEKTELHGEHYRSVTIDEQVVSLPRPFLFQLEPGAEHPLRESAQPGGFLLCLYDNAGEHFLPGADTSSGPGTQHLGRSEVLFFLFDPTQDVRFRRRCREVSDDPQLERPVPPIRQDVVLNEAARRIRAYAQLPSNTQIEQPLIVLVSKCDIWATLIDETFTEPPYIETGDPNRPCAVDTDRIDAVSSSIRSLLVECAPEIVQSAEGLSKRVEYLPVSALGQSPNLTADGQLRVRADRISPRWVTVPFVYALARWTAGLIPRIHRRTSAPENASETGTEIETSQSEPPLAAALEPSGSENAQGGAAHGA